MLVAASGIVATDSTCRRQSPHPCPRSALVRAARLPRVIGVGALAASAVNTIVGSGIFGLPGLAAAMLGPAAVLAYLVCAVLIGLVGLCLAEVGSRVADAGGLYAYATAAFGPVVGGIAGTLLWVANSVVAGAAVATLLADTLTLAAPPLGGGFPRVGVSRDGVRAAGRRQHRRRARGRALSTVARRGQAVAAAAPRRGRHSRHPEREPALAGLARYRTPSARRPCSSSSRSSASKAA